MSLNYNKYNIATYTRTMTGNAIPLSATDLYVARVVLTIPNGNAGAAVTLGDSVAQPVSHAKNASYTYDFTAAPHGTRINLKDIYVNSTNNDVINVLYWS